MTLPVQGERQNLISMKLVTLEQKFHTNQTGWFPVTSSLGNKYVLVLFDADTNAILAEPLRDRSQEHLVAKQISLYSHLAERGFNPKVQFLDNECPKRLVAHFEKQGIKFTLVPPHLHRTNAAECSIQTFKAYLISGIASCDPNFPLHLGTG